MIGVCVLGATGSIGASAADVLARHPDRFRVVALTANRDVEGLVERCRQLAPEIAVMRDESAADTLRERLGELNIATEVWGGEDALQAAAALPRVHAVLAAIVGAAGLMPAMAAVRAGKRVLLANKEALVMAGAIFLDEVARSGAELLPVDSEHNAILQCLPPGRGASLSDQGVRRILLTSSGGPLRRLSAGELDEVTPEQACAHPNWSMGAKISVDSATMMNKGLEIIEACWLFDAAPDDVEVVVHPQSIVHSMVEYRDGSVLAQLGNPDMRTPIAHALASPDRVDAGVSALDLVATGRLEFEAPDAGRFPCLELGREAVRLGRGAPAVVNAANEVAVAAFLEGELRFTRVPEVIRSVLETMGAPLAGSLDEVVAIDRRAREVAQDELAQAG